MKRDRLYATALLVSCLLPALFGCTVATSPPPSPTQSIIPATATRGAGTTSAASPEATVPPHRDPAKSPTPSPEAEPTWAPPAPPTVTSQEVPVASVEEVVVQETTISIPAYAYEPYLRQALDEQHDVPYLWLDRMAYGEPSVGSTALRPFTAVVLENRHLRLTILPELGGRIYECVFKPTGQNIFYRNRVLKPTPWGPLTRAQNWWLAVGGMEWAFPVHEHGYEWGVPWTYTVERTAGGATVTLRDTTEARPRVRVEISLAPNTAYFVIRPHVENPTSSPVSYQYWTNAMLTLGGSTVSPNTEFVYPTDDVVVHSAGPGSGLPEERALMDWPVWQGRDLSWYHNWEDWLGFFIPDPGEDFVGAYNHDAELGVARVFSRQDVPGVKLFAWGQQSPYAYEYTDDGSQYFEMWGGPNRTFWPEDDISLEPGGSKSWLEYWYPFQGIGGLDYANRELALSLRLHEDSLDLGVAATSNQEVTILLSRGDEEFYRGQVVVSPESSVLEQLSLPSGLLPGSLVSVTVLDPEGRLVASYETGLRSP